MNVCKKCGRMSSRLDKHPCLEKDKVSKDEKARVLRHGRECARTMLHMQTLAPKELTRMAEHLTPMLFPQPSVGNVEALLRSFARRVFRCRFKVDPYISTRLDVHPKNKGATLTSRSRLDMRLLTERERSSSAANRRLRENSACSSCHGSGTNENEQSTQTHTPNSQQPSAALGRAPQQLSSQPLNLTGFISSEVIDLVATRGNSSQQTSQQQPSAQLVSDAENPGTATAPQPDRSSSTKVHTLAEHKYRRNMVYFVFYVLCGPHVLLLFFFLSSNSLKHVYLHMFTHLIFFTARSSS